MAPSDLDLKSGFIHLSSARQIPGTLTHFFASPPSDRTSLYLLKIPLAPLETAEVLRWESPDAKVCGSRDGEGMFPHVYFADGRLGLSDREVQSVREVVSEQGQLGWEAALAGLESWLV
ncbi:uncharacterized protein HMPREF1541_07830 [Cyphellophora europaea CBS 101466]|uniref:DUF952 domain-containing protein n=1 Tax=Cyphellophora europaea (strain CBS 101466) TaxID=1220924 RepID=W2RMB4_CYPE1|nr:uncharacterized protein HMPREF1541_07830 [Cyphellophora europaea CBS 101466]ETN36843.1 hypothetical protein HMPREF1541_07830 [Cyphellophora europaea CBS 101466]